MVVERDQEKPEEERNGGLKYIQLHTKCSREDCEIKLVKNGEIMGEMIGHSNELGSYPKQI